MTLQADDFMTDVSLWQDNCVTRHLFDKIAVFQDNWATILSYEVSLWKDWLCVSSSVTQFNKIENSWITSRWVCDKTASSWPPATYSHYGVVTGESCCWCKHHHTHFTLSSWTCLAILLMSSSCAFLAFLTQHSDDMITPGGQTSLLCVV